MVPPVFRQVGFSNCRVMLRRPHTTWHTMYPATYGRFSASLVNSKLPFTFSLSRPGFVLHPVLPRELEVLAILALDRMFVSCSFRTWYRFGAHIQPMEAQ